MSNMDIDRRRLAFVGALIVSANALDLASTYAVSPNLANEWNLLQRQFGLGWSGLIAAKLIGMWLAFAGYSFYLRHRTAIYPRFNAGFGEFCRCLSFGTSSGFDPLSRREAWRRLAVNLGYFWTGMQALVVWVAIDNLLLGQGLAVPLRHLSETGYHFGQSWVVAGLVLGRFYWGNYRRYISASRPYDEHAVVPAAVCRGARPGKKTA